MSEPRYVPPPKCDVHFERHPTRPELVAVCVLTPGHDGPHSNVLSKAATQEKKHPDLA